ncbi:MAG: sodium:solute symporter family protein [Opitutales bacterium]
MHIVDISIIAAFLVATLYIGFTSGKKIKTFSDYAIGNRKFSDFAIFCTLAATIIGGTATMGEVGKFYDVGIVQFLAEIVEPIEYLIIAILLARHFGNYYGCYSVGDIFYKSYGLTGKILVGLVGSIYEILLVALQFVAMGTGISILTGFSYITSLWISAGIILIYTGRGGIRAVTFTDVLQFIILIIALPILLITTIGKIGGLSSLIDQLPQSHLTVKTEDFHRYLFLMFPLLIPLLSPILVHRLLMTSNREQGVRAYRNLAWTYAFLILLTSLLGLTAKVLFPNLARGDEALLTLITNGLPVGIFGIAVIGILAVLMSTADSHLNCGSIMFVNDLILPFIKRELSESTKLKMVRITSLIIGICALIVASQRFNIFETRILVSTLWFSVIVSPLYFLLFNMKISHKGLLISAILGFTTCILWNLNIKPIIKIDGLFPGFLISGLTVLFFYFLGGRQKVFTKEELEAKRLAEMQA